MFYWIEMVGFIKRPLLCSVSLNNDQVVVLVVNWPALLAGDGDVACALVAAVLAPGVARSAAVRAGDDGEGLVALEEIATVVCPCVPTDALDKLRWGLDEGVPLFAVVAVGLGDLPRADLPVADVLVHVAVDVLGDKLLVALADLRRLAVSTQGDGQEKHHGKQKLLGLHCGG